MGAIVDILHLGQNELCLIKAKYPYCLVTNESNSYYLMQRYRIIIPNEIEENYYLYLLDNCIAMSSTNFLGRVDSDERFAESMRARIKDAIKKFTELKGSLKAS